VKPAAVAVLAVERVGDSFDARRSARGRVYLYRILNRRPPPVLERGRVWHVGPRLDAEAMQEAARSLLGKHDFTSFRDSLCQAKSPVKTLDLLDVTRAGGEIRIEARARSFLHHASVQISMKRGSHYDVVGGFYSGHRGNMNIFSDDDSQPRRRSQYNGPFAIHTNGPTADWSCLAARRIAQACSLRLNFLFCYTPVF